MSSDQSASLSEAAMASPPSTSSSLPQQSSGTSHRKQIVIVDDTEWSDPQSTSMISTSTSSLNSTSTSTSGSLGPSTTANQDFLLVRSLVCDFFESQFYLKGESCDFHHRTSSFYNTTGTTYREFQEVAAALRQLGEEYVQDYEEDLKRNIEQFQRNVQPENLAKSFEYLSGQMFIQGIDWHFILTYFVFSAQLAQFASRTGLASVDDVASWVIDYTDGHLTSWIKQNGGWVSFFSLIL